MEQKKLIATAIVAIVIVAAFCVAAYALKNDDDDYNAKVTGNVPVYGNANNDDYIDAHDIDILNTLKDKGTWDKEEYPYADADQDGTITQNDIDIVQKIIDGDDCKI